jgi:hypothetical protein
MGNTPTTLNNKDNESFLKELDTLIANFISQDQFQYYKNLSDIEECNKIFVVSKDLFKKYLDNEKTTALNKRVKTGSIVFKRDLEIVTDKTKIKKFIEDIATFYTTIANVITTISLSMGLNINDIYSKSLKRQSLSKEDRELLTDAKTLKKYQDHLQKTRMRQDQTLNSLNSAYGLPTTITPVSTSPFFPSPMFSPMTMYPHTVDHSVIRGGAGKVNANLSPSTHSIKILSSKIEEVDFCQKRQDMMNYEAIKELLKLFNNTTMDPKTLEFSDIDSQNDTLKQHAIARLKEAFDKTNSNELLKKMCEGDAKLSSNEMREIKKNEDLLKLFQEYGKNLGKIALLEKDVQEKLLKIIKLIIVFPTFGNSNYRINPELTHGVLDKLVEKTRNILVKYFIEIEVVYAICLDIYLLLLEKLKLFERKTLSNIQEELHTIQDAGGKYGVKKEKKKNKTKKKKFNSK